MPRLFVEFRWVKSARWDRHVAFGAIVIGAYFAMLVAVAWLAQWTEGAAGVGFFRRVTDVPCPLCRGSRAAESLAHADLLGALEWNPLATLLLIGACVWAVIRFGLARRLQVTPTRTGRRVLWSLATLGLIANWAYVIAMGG